MTVTLVGVDVVARLRNYICLKELEWLNKSKNDWDWSNLKKRTQIWIGNRVIFINEGDCS
jgi:hypothetical protein